MRVEREREEVAQLLPVVEGLDIVNSEVRLYLWGRHDPGRCGLNEDRDMWVKRRREGERERGREGKRRHHDPGRCGLNEDSDMWVKRRREGERERG